MSKPHPEYPGFTPPKDETLGKVAGGFFFDFFLGFLSDVLKNVLQRIIDSGEPKDASVEPTLQEQTEVPPRVGGDDFTSDVPTHQTHR